MNRPKFLTPKFIECFIRYIVYFLAVAVTPYLAKPIAPFFDWAGYGLMRSMFVDIFTVIFWALEWVIIFVVAKKIKKSRAKKANERVCCMREAGVHFLEGKSDPNLSKENADIIGAHLVEKAEDRRFTKARKKALIFESENREKAFKIREPLPMKNVLLLTFISVLCIFIISAVTGFKVKPIYDIGEKVTGYEMYNKIGMLGRNVFKCFWIFGIMQASKGIAEELIFSSSLSEKKHWVRWLIEAVLVLAFGLFDVFASVMVHPLTTTRLLVGITYIFFYLMFVPVHALTEGSDVKAFLIVLLIYMF